jgi:hypothetical protein
MTHAHNVLIRGLNSIYQQGAFVSDPQDVSDFLFYCLAWVKTVEHHHAAEEKTLFPELEKFTNNPDIMAENKHQHDAFLAGLTDFEHYAESTTPATYRWNEAKSKLDAFTPALMTHLRDEIATLLSLKQYDSAKLRTVWDVTENAAKGDIRLPGMFVSCIKSSCTKHVTNRISGYHSPYGARLCGQDVRRWCPQVPAISILLSLPDRLLVWQEASGCMAVLSLRYAWEASAVAVYGKAGSLGGSHGLRVESWHYVPPIS